MTQPPVPSNFQELFARAEKALANSPVNPGNLNSELHSGDIWSVVVLSPPFSGEREFS